MVKKAIATLGPVAAPVTRTLGQGITANWILDGFETWNIYDFTDKQYGWTLVGLTTFMSWLMNTIEKRNGRKLIASTT